MEKNKTMEDYWQKKRNQERETPSTNGDKGRAMEEVGAKKGNLM